MYDPDDDYVPGGLARRQDARSIVIDRFQRTGRGTWEDLKRATRQYEAVDDGRQEILHRIIAEEIIFSRHMEYATTILLPSMYTAVPALARSADLADLIGTVFFNMHRISEAHHALLQHYRGVQKSDFPFLSVSDIITPLTQTLLEMQSVYATFLAHNPFALSKLEVEMGLNKRLGSFLTRMSRAPSADGQDLHNLLSAPGLHLNSLSQHLSVVLGMGATDEDAEEILIDISVLTSLQDVEPAPASEDEKEMDRLEARERSLLGKSVWDDDGNRELAHEDEDERQSKFRQDFWFLHPTDGIPITSKPTEKMRARPSRPLDPEMVRWLDEQEHGHKKDTRGYRFTKHTIPSDLDDEVEAYNSTTEVQCLDTAPSQNPESSTDVEPYPDDLWINAPGSYPRDPQARFSRMRESVRASYESARQISWDMEPEPREKPNDRAKGKKRASPLSTNELASTSSQWEPPHSTMWPTEGCNMETFQRRAQEEKEKLYRAARAQASRMQAAGSVVDTTSVPGPSTGRPLPSPPLCTPCGGREVVQDIVPDKGSAIPPPSVPSMPSSPPQSHEEAGEEKLALSFSSDEANLYDVPDRTSQPVCSPPSSPPSDYESEDEWEVVRSDNSKDNDTDSDDGILV